MSYKIYYAIKLCGQQLYEQNKLTNFFARYCIREKF